MKYYSVYKITNLLNNKIYIGYHVTEDLEDSYMGSNVHLKNSIKKYGIENFKKETLYTFDNHEDMVNKEIELVNEDFVKDNMTYNKNLGGKGGFYYINSNAELRKKMAIKSKEAMKTEEVRHKISKGVKKFAKNNPDKIKEWNEKAVETRLNKTKEEKDSIKDKKIATHKINYNTLEGKLKRETISKKYKELYSSKEGEIIKKKIKDSVLKSSFRDCFYNEYEKLKYDLLSLVINSNLLDKDIKKILNLPYKISTMLKYYERKGYISDVCQNRLNEISHSVIVKKYTCSLKSLILPETFILYKYIRADYIQLFLEYQEYLFGNYSDSYIYNNLKLKHFNNILKYMEYLSIIRIVDKKQIDISWLKPKNNRKKATKTIIEFNKNFKQNYKLIDKENLDEHSIASSFDGQLVSISWNKL